VRGRYELQVLDDFGKPIEEHAHMSIYGWTAPAVNASKPAGEWQTMEAVVVGNKVTVTLNGQKVHDNAMLEAITGGALDANETERAHHAAGGPRQGLVRKVIVTPITNRQLRLHSRRGVSPGLPCSCRGVKPRCPSSLHAGRKARPAPGHRGQTPGHRVHRAQVIMVRMSLDDDLGHLCGFP
jgi:hypothetical protein